ncbi:MAG: NADP-dependent isocitrate dehydrogenase [Phenylobacterium sp.]|uniref:NADP-dependent isocitrate dehydrogenase n=1 Tax=Phenylobacterium sp. TaxID=1871053 RepID=UPI0027326C90|nr:NADP-dependent isocitrate dehydrogenase [Phenylobacterium sp.]MDP1642933.1 NADP-dependent isocitrate dehydrogenase [Phenylobacterium sp.]MDP3117403.1 NADP-dependent isocitrate dehydrogenase [Phenylobacterium sp.]MDZ4054418.1 NADP-dependent isocitrate dehydrogenase [Phenylobacterium sp.]
MVIAPTPITVAQGDGVGPEIMSACLRILEAGGARLAPEVIPLGEAVWREGHTAGVTPEGWESLRRTGVFYKAPVATPQGGGMKSLNVTIRKSLGLFANVRPCTAYAPFVATRHPAMDLVIIRENEEDLYAGIEHQQTQDVVQCLKLVSRPGCERIARYAFEYARSQGRRKITCMTKDNIMKLTDGLFRKVFEEVGQDYPEIAQDHMIIDIGAARIADSPEAFDVILAPNLYGDIISDIAAQVAGSVGLAPSANIGARCAMFEAVHGSAPDIAGQDVANPSGLLLAGLMMLNHVGQGETAARIHNAWLCALEDGLGTPDMKGTVETLGTQAFAAGVISRMGRLPQSLKPVSTRRTPAAPISNHAPAPRAEKTTVGVDLFIDWRGDVDTLAAQLKTLERGPLGLKMITNRGVKVWPEGLSETNCVDHWRCRFMNGGSSVPLKDIAALTVRAAEAGLEFIKTENLCAFDGQPGFSLGQGQ